MKQSSGLKATNNKDIQEPIMAERIELLIQLLNNITIPSIVFEYISNKEADFEINDLKNFYTSFGEVIDFIIKDKISIVLYKTFFSANACKEFLLNENNFKDNMKKNFSVKWFDIEKDINILPNDLQKLFKDIHNKNIINLINYNKINISNTNENIINNINSKNNDININENFEYLNNNNINENFDLLNNNINNINNNNINNINNNNIINVNKINNNQIDYNIIGNQNSNNDYISPNLIMQYNQMKMNQNLLLNNINNNLNNINNNFNNNNQNLNLINYLSNLNELSNNMAMPSSINIPVFLNNQNNVDINNIKDVNNINNYQLNQNKNNIKQYINNNNQNIEEKNYGRYTCKYRILIPNDKDFQIARRLIGSKGYNMKKIVNECCKNSNNNKDNVKLRLRGKGSGFKEGIENKESDEPLHLCISAKNQEEMNKACKLVENLLNKIYEDYKIFCFKNKIIPTVNQIAIRIDGGNSLQKNK